MPGNPREIITMAERSFPVRIRIAIPPEGLGRRHAQITAWLDENCGADGWAMTPSGIRGVLNDAVSDLLCRCHVGRRIRRPVMCRLRSSRPTMRFMCATMIQHPESWQDCTARLESDLNEAGLVHRGCGRNQR
jgi:hypothetical protein